jgi:hypothetical protein
VSLSEIPTPNFFDPLRAVEVDRDTTAADGADLEPLTQQQQQQQQQQQPHPVPKWGGRALPTILTTTISLLKFQWEIKTFVKGTLEFHEPGYLSRYSDWLRAG